MQTFIKEILSNFPKSGRPSPEIAVETRKLVYQGYSIIYKIGSKKYRISYYL
jgi:plasmid stabilization system protein ParE